MTMTILYKRFGKDKLQVFPQCSGYHVHAGPGSETGRKQRKMFLFSPATTTFFQLICQVLSSVPGIYVRKSMLSFYSILPLSFSNLLPVHFKRVYYGSGSLQRKRRWSVMSHPSQNLKSQKIRRQECHSETNEISKEYKCVGIIQWSQAGKESSQERAVITSPSITITLTVWSCCWCLPLLQVRPLSHRHVTRGD